MLKKSQTIVYAILFMIGINLNAQQNFTIDQNWEFRQLNMGEWLPAEVPGTVHTDLLANEQIEDPYFRTNERDQQWIDKVNWEYKTQFNIESSTFNEENIELIFNGLDTYAEVYLNDVKILTTNNMFRIWKSNVKGLLNLGSNELYIIFHSPIIKGLEAYEKFGLPLPANNDQSENGGLGKNKVSVHTRKAGYHYGWDWGPRFVTSGIWRPIEINSWSTAQITDNYVYTEKITSKNAFLRSNTTVRVSKPGNYNLVTKVNGIITTEESMKLQNGTNEIHSDFQINNAKLWWPVGLGEAYLYNIVQELHLNGEIIDVKAIKTGVRTVKLVQEEDKDKKGSSFYFEVNGVPVFAKGANYIPNDMFLPRVTLEDYESVLNSAVDANMNMIRVWGGGIYENDVFYELCDQKGLMVWQDFMFACSMYPDTPELIENIKEEAIDNVIRLRNHPSVVLWCGNNEIEVAWSEYDHSRGWGGWRKSYSRPQQNKIWAAYERIFHDVLPQAVETYTNNMDYWKSSPSAGPEKVATYNTTSGDIHYWGVWHGLHPISDFNNHVGRFMSEYGFQSFPEFSTVDKYTIPSDWNIESDVMAAHQRSGIGNLRIKQYMESHYKTPKNFKFFLYVSQLLQAKAIKEALEVHRRQMPYCMGSLYWQLNDCWPVASWSSTDYYRNWKAQQYIAKKAFEPIHISPEISNKTLNVYVVSDKLEQVSVRLEIDLLNLDGTVYKSFRERMDIAANTSRIYFSKPLEEIVEKHNKKELVLVSRLLIDEEIISENFNYFVEPKDLKLEKPIINTSIETNAQGKSILVLTTNTLAKDAFITLNGRSLKLSDNYFDLMPNVKKKIEIEEQKVDVDALEITTLFDTYN